MNRVARCGGLVLLALVLLVPAVAAQPAADFGLAEGIRQVDEGEFDNAIVTLDTAARRLAGDPKRIRELSQAYLYLGIAYVGKGHEAAAKAKFREALAGMKDLSLSAERYPPKVIDLFEAARADARAPAAAPAAASAPAKKGGGGGKTLLVVGGLAAVGGGVALAAGSGGGSSGSTDNNSPSTPGQTFERSGTLAPGPEGFVVTPSRAGTLEASVSWTDRNLKLDVYCQEEPPPYTGCGGTYNRTSDTTARYTANVPQKPILVIVHNYETVPQSFTLVIRYP
jgi:hypothetical protein